MASVKKNALLNGINTITGIIFPVITFPYAARVLLPDGIGAVNFLNSIVSYIVLLTSLGIPMYAVKEVAKYRDDIAKRDKITIEIIVLSVVLCFLGYILVWILANFVPQIHAQFKLFYILSLTIVFTTIGVNWFYQGIEEFVFISIRAIIIRTIAAAALFIFVKNSSDLLIYGVIIVGSTVGNNLINFFHLRKHVTLKNIKLRDLEITRHIGPSFQVFILNLIISLYIQLNSIMLGFMVGDDGVGYYTAGTRISHIGLTVISSLGTVLLPRCSHLIQTGQTAAFQSIIKKSLNVTMGLSVPMTIGLMVLAAPITFIFCGKDYAPAIPVLFINAPVIIFISLTNVMGIQVLYAMDKIKIVIYSVAAGALMNILVNIILIPSHGATGAAAGSLIAEFAVLLVQLIWGRSLYPFRIMDILNKRYILGSIIMGLATYLSVFKIPSNSFKLVVGVPIGITIYATFLIIAKDPLIVGIKTNIIEKIRHAK